MNLLPPLRSFLAGFDLRSTGKWFFLSSLIGVVAGMGAIAFQFLSQLVAYCTAGAAAGFHPGEAAGDHSLLEDWLGFQTLEVMGGFSPWILLLVLVAGGLISGILVYAFAPEAEGHGTDAAIDSFHHKGGQVRTRVPLIKTIASALTLGTGGSGGREGPIAQIGAGFGSFLATRLKLSSRDRRIMMAAGMGAGVGAIFRAPLAGALFAGEILYKDADIESDTIVPGAIASIIAYSVYCIVSLPGDMAFTPLFGNRASFTIGSPLELGPLALLALVLALVGIFHIKFFYGVHALFERIPIMPHLRPALGAGLAGLFAIGLYKALDDVEVLAVLFTGYGAIQKIFDDPMAISAGVLLAIAIGKIITTAFTISSGGSGGVFGPSIVIGACVGGAVGQVLHQLWPEVVTHPSAYIIVGMAGFFAGCAHAPFSTILMVTEMTGDYKLLLPAMWVSTLCFLLCRRWTIYVKQLPSRLDSPAHRGDFIIDILADIRVRDVFNPGRKVELIPESMPLRDVVHLLANTEQNYFPVVDKENRVTGIFSARDVRSFIYDESVWQVAIAKDVMVSDVVSVRPEDSLNTALRNFTVRNIDELPVFEPEHPRMLLGMLRRRDVIAFYNQRLQEHKERRAT